MAFRLSPSVDITEKDLTLGVSAVATSIGAFAGPFQWGPVEKIVTVASEPELVSRFGKPNDDVAADWLCAANFLGYGNNLKNVRVIGALAKNSSVTTDVNYQGTWNATSNSPALADGMGSDGDFYKVTVQGTQNLGSGNITFLAGDYVRYNATTGKWVRVPVIVKNDDDFERQVGVQPFDFVGRYPGALGNGLEVHACRANGFSTWLYKGSFDGAPVGQEVHVLVLDGSGDWTGTPGTILEKYPFLSLTPNTLASDGTNIHVVDVINRKSNYVWACDNALAGIIDQISDDTTPVNEVVAVVTNDAQAVLVSETFDSNDTVSISYNPAAINQNFPAVPVSLILALTTDIVLGDVITVVNNTTPGTVTVTPNYTTNELTITAGAVSGDDVTVTIDKPAYTLNAADYDLTAPDTIDFSPVLAYAGNITVTITPNAVYNVALDGGVSDNTSFDRTDGFALFQDAELVDINLLFTGAASQVEAEWALDNVAETRKDCVAFISPLMADVVNNPGNEQDDCITFRNLFNSSSYGVMDCNWKYQYDRYNDKFRWVPLNGDIAGLCARTDDVADPWFSPAGFNRGQIKNVTKLAWNPNKTNRDELYKNGINPVVTFPGEGTVLYGDRTMLSRPSAFRNINVRRLFITIEKAIATSAKFLLFEFNDEFSRGQFLNLVNPYLRNIQGRRGIIAFNVVCDDSNNTGQVIDNNEFIGDIYVKPSRSINNIQLNFVAVRTDVSFEEIG